MGPEGLILGATQHDGSALGSVYAAATGVFLCLLVHLWLRGGSQHLLTLSCLPPPLFLMLAVKWVMKNA